jgi:hypothetical protein
MGCWTEQNTKRALTEAMHGLHAGTPAVVHRAVCCPDTGSVEDL